MHSAILYGLSHAEEDVVQQLNFTCPTGNCTWSTPFESLSVCSKCADLSDVLETHNDTGAIWVHLMRDNDAAEASLGSRAYRLPNKLIIDNANEWTFPDPGAEIRNPVTMMTTFGTGDPSQSDSFQDMETLIWATSILKVQKRFNSSDESLYWPDLPIQATECALYYCINQYQTSIIGGKLHEETNVVPMVRDPKSWQSPYEGKGLYLFGNLTFIKANKSIVFDSTLSGLERSDLRLVGNDEYYNISQNAVDSISWFFQSSFTSTLSNQSTSFISEMDKTGSSWDGIVPGRLNGFYMKTGQEQYDPSVSQVYWSRDDIPALFNAIARSMSNTVRDGADPETGQTIVGSSGVLVTFYQVQWAWIAVHLAVLAGVAFLIATIYQGRSVSSFTTVPSWKSSALAPLSLGAQLGHVFEAGDSAGEMARTAEKQHAKLFLKSHNVSG